MSYRAVSQTSTGLRVALVRLMPMIGNAENVSRWTCTSAAAGSAVRISDRRLNTYNSACGMSVDQSKNTLTSAEPRDVVERIFTVPGIFFIASSTGRVMVAIISSAGITPLSIRMTTRGKLVCGNTDDGIVTARIDPGQAECHNHEQNRLGIANDPAGAGTIRRSFIGRVDWGVARHSCFAASEAGPAVSEAALCGDSISRSGSMASAATTSTAA